MTPIIHKATGMPYGVVDMLGWITYEEPVRMDINEVLRHLRSLNSVWFVTTKYAQYFCMVDVKKKNHLPTVCDRLKIAPLDRTILVRWNTFMSDALHNGPPYPLHTMPGGPEFLLPLMEEQVKRLTDRTVLVYNPLLLVWDRSTEMGKTRDE